jgi:hypothetical protein
MKTLDETRFEQGRLDQGPARGAHREDEMAKGQLKGNKEAKKPKADKPKGGGSAYKQSQGKGGQALSPQSAKKG